MARIQPLSDADFLELLRLATGLLPLTDGDICEAMRRAMPLHVELLRTIRHEEIRAAVQGATAVLHVPEQGGLAVRTEGGDPPPSHDPLAGFDLAEIEVSEPTSSHFNLPTFDAGVLDEDWD